MTGYRRKRINKMLMLIFASMMIVLVIDVKPAVAEYMEWQWLKSDKMAGYLKEQALENGINTIFGTFIPGFSYVEQHYVEVAEISDPSYDKYLDVPEKSNQYEELDMGSFNQQKQQSEDMPAQSTQSDILAWDEDSETDLEKMKSSISDLDDIEKEALTTTVTPVNTGNITTISPKLFSQRELLDFGRLLADNYTVTSITELKQDMFDVEAALAMDMSIQQDNSQPQILIFHTHSQEGFVDSVPDDPSTMITGVGEYLTELLRGYGYQVIHDTGVYDLVDGQLDRSKAYTYAEEGIEKILAQYPSIEVVIDLHRDGVDESNHLITEVNGKPTAKIMFFNGISYTKVNGNLDYLPNPYIEENLAMSLQMKLIGDSYYPGLLRKNYIHGYRYCLHYREKSMLIEVGAQNNTLQEELNAMEPLAEMLHRLLSGEKTYK